MKNTVKISSDFWFEISSSLESHHAIFYKLWQIGKPTFTEEIETAAIQFDKEGEFFVFIFNPIFWNSLDLYNKLFIICHECLHVTLNHGVRIKDSTRFNRLACNLSLDLVVNHLLIEKFGFEKEKIKNHESYCWVDNIFPHKTVDTNETYEFYYNLFEKTYGDGGPGTGNIGTVDDHNFMEVDSNKLLKTCLNDLSEEEKDPILDVMKKNDAIPNVEILEIRPIKKKNKWETVISNWSSFTVNRSEKDVEQWCRLNRRLSAFSSNVFLPSTAEIETIEKKEDKLNVYFFMDTSGSCWGLKDRFFSAALSLPEERFSVRLFCFDTKVVETSLKSRKVFGGGNTKFSILEEFIQKQVSDGEDYPQGVFVITDGYGDIINPKKASNWYWFLTENSTKRFISKKCNFFELEKFE